MAGPITWRNVSPVDSSSNVNAYLRAGAQLGQGISGFGEAVGGFVDDRVQAQTDMMTGELLSAGDDINAANAIVQKYAGGQFAPTAESIQRAQGELRSIAEFNSGMRMDDLNRSAKTQQMDLAAAAEKRAQEKVISDAAQRAVENKRAETELKYAGDRNSWNNAASADANRDRDLTAKERQNSLAFDADITALLQGASAGQDVSAAALALTDQKLTSSQLARLNPILDQVAQGITLDIPETWKLPTGAINPGFTSVSDKQLSTWENQQVDKIARESKVSQERARELFNRKAAADGYDTFKTNVNRTNEAARTEESRIAENTTMLKKEGNPSQAILNLISSTNPKAKTWSADADIRNKFVAQTTNLLKQIQDDPVQGKKSKNEQFDLARSIMNAANYYSDAFGLFSGFNVPGTSAAVFWDDDADSLSSTELNDLADLYGSYKN